MTLNQEQTASAKRNAALAAVKHVKNGFVVGLGSGTTAALAIREIGSRIRKENLKIIGVPTSYQAFLLAVENLIPITTLDEHPRLDLTIDGADQIDSELNLIKGMGGCLAKEKIVATVSKKNIIVADQTKTVKTLGEKDHPVPVEVLPFAASQVIRRIKSLKGKPMLREGTGKLGPIVTDNGNFIVDARFGIIEDVDRLESSLKMLVGVVETGLFLGMADIAYIGGESGTKEMRTPQVRE